MIGDFLSYAEFHGFWETFSPETPFGREVKERQERITDRARLARLHDETEAVLGFLDQLEGPDAIKGGHRGRGEQAVPPSNIVRRDRISHHLKRMPRFPDQPAACFDEVELFQVKKFLHNFLALVDLVDPAVARVFDLHGACEDLLALLDRGRQGAEFFYLADAYSAELAEVRAAIAALDRQLLEQDAARAAEIQSRYGLVFGDKAFLLVPRERLGDLEAAAHLLLIDPYDGQLVSVRPLRSPEALVLGERRHALALQEQRAEQTVLEELSRAVCREMKRLVVARESVRAFDLAWARARMARELGLTRPILQEGALRIEGGRFLPCETLCASLGTPYEALDATFSPGATVIFGSNMGGKTIVLKTVAFLQLCVQTGLFVPARRLVTPVYPHLAYVGARREGDAHAGLSGFGTELAQFMEAWEHLPEDGLWLFDEFARTTHSREAEALLSAVLEVLQSRQGVALFSTHFHGVARLEGVAYRRMHGLDRAGLETPAPGEPLEARLRRIAARMVYRLEADDGTHRDSDALAVARLLGLDPTLCTRAERFFTTQGKEE